MCFLLIWCLIRSLASQTKPVERVNRKQCRKQKGAKACSLQTIWGWCPESLAVKAYNQASPPFSSFDRSASVKYSMRWAFILVQEEPNDSLFACSLLSCLLGHHCSYIFFLVPSSVCCLVQCPHRSKPPLPLQQPDMIKQPLEFGQVACTNALELVCFFLTQKLNCLKRLLFWPYTLSYEFSCYFCSIFASH